MQEIRAKARELMQGFCRVCPVCNGKACAGEVPGMGGIGTGASFTANVESLSRIKLNMRLIHDAVEPNPSVSLLGKTLDIPVLAAPIGGVSFNMGGKISEEEYVQAVLGGCADKGTLGCTGDGVPAFIHETAFSAIKETNGKGIPFIKPWEDDEFFTKLEKALDTGTKILGMDIDAAGLITLRKMGRPVSPKPRKKIEEIISRTPAKFILKGIMTPGDAKEAVEAGAAGIVVSNHGGRVLDHTPGTADVLPGIVAAVNGRAAVLVDGGIRTGVDVLKMIALGADAVLIGRPFSIAAMGGLKNGVMEFLDQLRGEIVQAMVLTGCPDLKAAGKEILATAP